MLTEIGWGLIGCGDVAEYKVGPALYNVPRSSLVGVMSRRAGRAESFAARHNAGYYCTDVYRLLEDENIDAIYIATPPNVHAALTRQVAEAGKHVLCEKPMALSTRECREMIAVCAANGVQLQIAYYRRFFPVIQKMKEIVDAGTIGRVLRARVETAEYYTERPDGERAWLIDPVVAGGGFLTDVGTHRLDLLVHFLGNPREVAALVDTQHFDFHVDDASIVMIRFDSGVHASGAFNWNIGAVIDEFEICGTEGRILSRNLGRGDLEVIVGGKTELYHLPAPAITHLHLVEHYVSCLLEDKPNDLSGEEGIKATILTEAAYRSARSGKNVRLEG